MNASRCILFSLTLFICAPAACAEDFEKSIRPILKESCLTCHSTEAQKGDLDLERFTTLAGIKRQPKVLQRVWEQLNDGEMPPKEKPQPSAEKKSRLMNWARETLDAIALEHAGDPGPVVLRRLSNAEYKYTIRDLTGVDSLDPGKEFPADGAAGEGFTNTGQALVMSPTLLSKYLDAGKEVATHALLLPDGIRFSAKTTRRDWTEEILAEIRALYREYSDQSGGNKVNLQGIVFETNGGGRLPLEKYFAATIELRDESRPQGSEVDAIAHKHGLSAKYLDILMNALTSDKPSLLLDGLRANWRAAKPNDAAALTAEVVQWQSALWKFASVGHIGKAGGPKAWMEPVTPMASKQDVRVKIQPPADGKDVTLYLVAGDAGDGNAGDVVIWERPRLVAPGCPDMLLKDVRSISADYAARRERVFGGAAKCLRAAAEGIQDSKFKIQDSKSVAELARKYDADPDALAAWLAYLGVGDVNAVKIQNYFAEKIDGTPKYDFIKGWGPKDTPNILANSSDTLVRIPGDAKPHGIVLHPSPKLQACVGWRSPIAATVKVEAVVQHAHSACGPGTLWSLEMRRGATRQSLANGHAQDAREFKPGPFEISVQPGDLISVRVGPRNSDHACGLTAVNLVITSSGEGGRVWNLAADVSPDILAGNPHADRFGNKEVWHFYTEPDKGGEMSTTILAESLLGKWQNAADEKTKATLADEVQKLLLGVPPADKDSANAKLYRQLTSLSGPLFAGLKKDANAQNPPVAANGAQTWGLDPAQFGKDPNGRAIGEANLCVQAPAVIEIHLPAELVAGCEFVTTGTLDKESGAEGSVQLQVSSSKPETKAGMVPSKVTVTDAKMAWTSDSRQISIAMPVIVNDGSAARKKFEAAYDEYRQLFPAALCYTKIVPVDEVVTLTLFYREDHHLARLMLDDAQKAKLDRLWDELHYVTQDALTSVDAFEQIYQFSTQDADPKVWEPLREPIKQRAAAFRQLLIDTQPKHLDSVLEVAERAYRRPMTDVEKNELRGLYKKLRDQELAHDAAIRLLIARVLVAPAFLYHAEVAAPGAKQAPVNAFELANRLSYFLWSSQPDAELRALAASRKLLDSNVLVAQTRRMMQDARVRRFGEEFGCAWMHIKDFDELNEKSERHFPTFVGLRGDMYEEPIRFFADLVQRDQSVLNVLDCDYTFLNEALAKHYGIPGVSGGEWRRVDGVKKYSRGGILAQAATLAKQSGASRTSPILRGNWVSEVLLGEKLPRPPKDVPRLPEDEAAETLTVRQLTEKHSSDARCAVCHKRIDPFGFALENFDAIGRFREKDLGNRPIDTHSKVLDGTEIDGFNGLRGYLFEMRHDAFLKQFSRKLLGYALGRGVQLSDEPLLKEMQARTAADGYRIGAAIETIVLSKQFREIRGRDATEE
ncbi:MAG TPA: DUF1592 domain-containing protein [Planctomycetota bacterium]|nr:DUF1592 domain-containing protein [Planctomycetota bacterium]